jgi:phage gpG-like protein
MIEMKVDIKPLETRLTFITSMLENSSALMRRIGLLLIQSIENTLDAGGKPTAFLPLKKPTGRPPLGGSAGSIGRSVHLGNVGKDFVEVVASGRPYLRIHQLGGVIHRTGAMKRGLSKAMGHPSEIRIPARRYMMVQDQDVTDIKQLILNQIKGAK